MMMNCGFFLCRAGGGICVDTLLIVYCHEVVVVAIVDRR